MEFLTDCTTCRHPLLMLFSGGSLLSAPIVDGRVSRVPPERREKLSHCPRCGTEIGDAFNPQAAGAKETAGTR